MRRIGFFEKFVNRTARTFGLSLTVLLTLTLLSAHVAKDKKTHFKSKSLTVHFDEFSPAFAAFEDDFLFDDEIKSIELSSGQSDAYFLSLVEQPVKNNPEPLKTNVSEKSANTQYLSQFDGGMPLQEAKGLAKSFLSRPLIKPKTKTDLKSEELRSGSLFAMVNNSKPQIGKKIPRIGPAPSTINPQAPAKKPGSNLDQYDDGFDDSEPDEIDLYQVSGSILLREGLAFIGSMEVSWVVGDHELQVGSINVPDATFEIEVSQLVGDIIVSLYDSNDDLIGEGLFNLNQLEVQTDSIATTIEVLPIDWDLAGHIVHSNSLGFDSAGTGVTKVVEGAEVALYAFNDATLSKKDGSFSFYNWKKTNSRTLAIASKEGFRDSIFMMDSKKTSDIFLFPNSYIESFFSYMKTLGIENVENQGLIYGQITGVPDRSGYEVKIKDQKPIYFVSGLASVEEKLSTGNGLFAFAGLEDGDYRITIERDGEIFEEKLVAVEQGKISPLRVNLAKTYKPMEFYDPMEPNRKISRIEVSFFDGQASQLSLDRNNISKVAITSSSDPGLLEINSLPESSRTLLSHNKGLQKVPFIQNSMLLKLAEKSDMNIDTGLVIGFIESEFAYEAAIIESPAEKTVYFNSKGQVIDPKKEVALGFIMGGFPKGLSSLLIEDVESGTILGTDIIFSNHDSVSIVQIDLYTEN